MANLTIRNITINPLQVTAVERFESDRVQLNSTFANVTGAVTGFFNATEFPSHHTVAKGEARHKRDVSGLRVDPFQTRQTDIRTADPGREVIRLTFTVADHRYQTDVPSPSAKSAEMKKLDGGPLELTVVYVPTGAFLAVFSSAKLHAWMQELHDEWPLPMLSIPGTHNSPTCYTALPSVRCQAVGVKEQLNNGVRFMDVRVSVQPGGDDTLTLCHSVFPIALTGAKYFKDMMDVVYQFLESNPSETIIMSIKREGTGKGTDQDLSKYLKHSYIDKDGKRWYTDPKIPALGQVRGRVVLMRRFGLNDELKKAHEGRGYGIDAAQWPDNCEDGKCGGGHIHVQDFYEVSETDNVQKKIDFSRGQLERAAQQMFLLAGMPGFSPAAPANPPPPPPFYVNFLSASNFFNASCWPERIAAKVNPAVVEYLCMRHGEEGKGPNKLKIGAASTGIVVTDWVGSHDDWDLIRCVVGWNARLQFKR
jgi:1-phosphatidylinositol phosphodiesterase